MLLMIAVYGLGGGHFCCKVYHEMNQDAYVMYYICACYNIDINAYC